MNNGFYEFSRGRQETTSSVFPYTGSAIITGSLEVIGILENGLSVTASGIYSHAEGDSTQALGDFSHAEGQGTIALARRQHVQGSFNLPSLIGSAFIVGNGSGDSNRSNLIFAAINAVQITGSLIVSSSNDPQFLVGSQSLIVSSSGNVGIGTPTPTVKLDVSGSALFKTNGVTTVTIGGSQSAASSQDGVLTLASSLGQNLTLDTRRGRGPRIYSTNATHDFDISAAAGSNLILNSTTASVGGVSIGISSTTGVASLAGKLDILDTTFASGSANSGSLLNLRQTWNTTGAPTALKLNVTDTASGASSLLMDIQKGGVSQIVVDKSGNLGVNAATLNAKLQVKGTGVTSTTNTLLLQNSALTNILTVKDDGSTIISGSLTTTQGITGSLFGTSSWAQNAVSSSKLEITNDIATNATHYILFSPSTTGSAKATIDSNTFTFNPSTDTLTSGDLTLAQLGSRTLTIQAYTFGGTEIKLIPNVTAGFARINVGNTNAPLDFQMNSVDVMRIAQDGKVGIGTTGATAKLEVKGTGSTSSTTTLLVQNSSLAPILTVKDDSTILLGNSQAPAFITTVKNTLTSSGAFTVYALPTSSYDGVFCDYTARSGSNARAGQIMAIWSGSSVNYTETTTTDFGNTTGLNLGVFISSSNMVITGSAATSTWTVKTIIRSI